MLFSWVTWYHFCEGYVYQSRKKERKKERKKIKGGELSHKKSEMLDGLVHRQVWLPLIGTSISVIVKSSC